MLLGRCPTGGLSRQLLSTARTATGGGEHFGSSPASDSHIASFATLCSARQPSRGLCSARPCRYRTTVQSAGRSHGEEAGAHVGIRTRDLFLTKEVLYRLSYVGLQARAEDRFYSEPLDRLEAPGLREPTLSRRFRAASALPPGGARTGPPLPCAAAPRAAGRRSAWPPPAAQPPRLPVPRSWRAGARSPTRDGGGWSTRGPGAGPARPACPLPGRLHPAPWPASRPC